MRADRGAITRADERGGVRRVGGRSLLPHLRPLAWAGSRPCASRAERRRPRRADVVGLALGVYVALVLRSRRLRRHDLLVLLWDDGARGVAAVPRADHRARLPAGRPVRAARAAGGPGRVLAALVLVALIVLAFGLGTDYDFTTTGLIPTAVVTCALAIGLLRAAYGSVSLELMKRRRRPPPARPRRRGARRSRASSGSSRAVRGGIGIEFVGVSPGVGRAAARSRSSASRRCSRTTRPDELLLAEADFDERDGARRRPAGTPARREGAPGAEHDRAARPRGRVRARRRACRCSSCGRPSSPGVDWAVKRVFDLVVSAAARRRRLAALALARGSPSSSTRAGRSSTSTRGSESVSGSSACSSSAPWSPTRPSSSPTLESENEACGRAVQDPRRPARDARRAGAAATLARRAAAARRTCCAAR